MTETARPTAVPHARVGWREGVPWSDDASDFYFSPAGGLDERRHVFLGGNDLPARWRKREHFTVAEVGFGTGLSFLATVDAWRTSFATGFLHYIAFERLPLRAEDMRRALSRFHGLGGLRDRLADSLPPPACGVHRIRFDEDCVALTLVQGDFADFAADMAFRADAWYLDGFSPGTSADAWDSVALRLVRARSHRDSTFATHTAASMVRRHMEEEGFRPEVREGYAHKREMLCGRTNGGEVRKRPRTPSRVAVIGAGLAGCSAAWSFARRGADVTLIERSAQVASGASGNDAAVTMPWMARVPDDRTRLSLAGFAYTRLLVRQLESEGFDCNRTEAGLLRFVNSARLEALSSEIAETGFERSFVEPKTAKEASELAGVRVSQPALYFPTGASLSPPAFCEALVASTPGRIRTVRSAEALGVVRGDGHWTVTGSSALLAEADVVVLAAANDCLGFAQTAWLPLESVRGQVVRLGPGTLLDGTKCILCGDGYVARGPGGGLLVGSSFEHGNASRELDQETQRDILRKLKASLPDFEFDEETELPGRVSFRSSAPDRLPVAGPVPAARAFEEAFDGSRYGSMEIDWSEPWWSGGLFVSTAHASHGLVTAPLAGEIVADMACGTPPPAPHSLQKAINPLRFLVKALNRKA